LVCRGLRNEGFAEILVHTGQHYDLNMSDIFFQELDIPAPDYNLGIGSGMHGKQTGKMLADIEEVLTKEKPDLVLVYGDTNSTLAGSLAASKLNIPIAHVEAGLRSFNKAMPEEINRVVTDHVSSILFCPTLTAIENLKKEGFDNISHNGELIEIKVSRNRTEQPLVINVGDVMYDVAKIIYDRVNAASILDKYNVETKKYILVTIHRAENTDNLVNLRAIWESLTDIGNAGIKILFPVHPRTAKVFKESGIDLDGGKDRIIMIEPVPYTEMIALEANARTIITDSGGVQKEGYFFKVPCVIPRNETEWVELVDHGWNSVTGVNKEKIIEKAINLPDMVAKIQWKQFFGDGHAVQHIVNVLKAMES
jgi:UDP-GlcNAc3NAcA epimerase